MSRRRKALQQIDDNIKSTGYHVYSVLGGESPRYLYTIGLRERLGFELVFAGHAAFPKTEVSALIRQIAEESLDSQSQFSLREVDQSWSSEMLLGALDYHQIDFIEARQLVPKNASVLIDVPDMSQGFSPDKEPVWRWLKGGWPYQVSPKSVAITNLDALEGYAISELARWEDDQWEMFSGAAPDIPKEEMLPVPLATLLAFDQSLEAALTLEIGKGLYREFGDSGQAGEWQAWGKRSKEV